MKRVVLRREHISRFTSRHVYMFMHRLSPCTAMYVHKRKSGHTPDPDRRTVRSETRLKKRRSRFRRFIISSYVVIKLTTDDGIIRDRICTISDIIDTHAKSVRIYPIRHSTSSTKSLPERCIVKWHDDNASRIVIYNITISRRKKEYWNFKRYTTAIK